MRRRREINTMEEMKEGESMKKKRRRSKLIVGRGEDGGVVEGEGGGKLEEET